MSPARRKITLIGDNPAAVVLLVEADVADLLLLGGDAEDLPRARGGAWPDAAGSDLVAVLDGGVPGEELLLHCPDAVIVIADEDPAAACRAVLESTRLPRGRVLGVAGRGPVTLGRRVAEVVLAVVLDRRRVLDCVVLCDGERGEAGLVEVPVCVGAGGVEAIV